MAIDKYASREWRQGISAVLNRDWDPIGVRGGAEDDEYASYVGGIAAMIREGKTDDDLMHYLEWAESEHMGFQRFNLDRARKVVAALRSLGPAP